jgi:hypothetical protein
MESARRFRIRTVFREMPDIRRRRELYRAWSGTVLPGALGLLGRGQSFLAGARYHGPIQLPVCYTPLSLL